MGEVGIHRVLQGVRYIMCHSHNTHNSRTVLDYRFGKLDDFTTSLKEAAVICQNVW